MLSGTFAITSSPSREKNRSGLTSNVMIRSPGGPPSLPRPPCPASRTRVPVSVPDGTVMFSVLRVRTSPAPLHVGQVFDGTCPRPRHIGHGRFTAKPPCPNDIVPRPLHSGHVFHVAPGAPPLP